MKPILHPIMAASVATYLAFVSLSLLHAEILYFAWPYPLLLSLQKWVSPDSLGSSIGGWTLGLGLVAAWAHLLRRILERPARRRKIILVGTFLVSMVGWLIPLRLALHFGVPYGVVSILECLALGSLVYLLSAVACVGWSQVRALGLLVTSVALISWYVPLVALQAVIGGIALAAGWPVGE